MAKIMAIFLLSYMKCSIVIFPGNKIGDECALDSDNDGINDSNDTCPHNPKIYETSFSSYFTIDFYPGYSTDPDWWVKAAGREIYQRSSTMKPAALIGKYGGFSSTGHFGV
jgi:hypothetical protein